MCPADSVSLKHPHGKQATEEPSVSAITKQCRCTANNQILIILSVSLTLKGGFTLSPDSTPTQDRLWVCLTGIVHNFTQYDPNSLIVYVLD